MSDLLSWGRYPHLPQTAHAAHWRDEAQARWRDVQSAHGTTLAFGNGRSYGDSLPRGSRISVQTLALDRIIGADWTTRRRARRSRASRSSEILAVAVPRGWLLPVTPGTKFVTLGGAIANDVHGKNHHVRGTFGRHVRAFGLAAQRRHAGRMLARRERGAVRRDDRRPRAHRDHRCGSSCS